VTLTCRLLMQKKSNEEW